jgi:hypothetical protein
VQRFVSRVTQNQKNQSDIVTLSEAPLQESSSKKNGNAVRSRSTKPVRCAVHQSKPQDVMSCVCPQQEV